MSRLIFKFYSLILLCMKFAVSSDHHRYIRENRFLPLEECFFEEQQQQLAAGIAEAMNHRIGPEWKKRDADELFVEGHDLHCDNSSLRRVISQRRLAMIISELLQCTPLRLGYDQYLPVNPQRSEGEEDPYGEFLRSGGNLKEVSCVQGVKGGLLICLEPLDEDVEQDFFPKDRGEAVLFKNDVPIPFYHLDGKSRGAFLLVTYADEVALYFQNKRDPHLHAFKRYGYGFGDKLREPNHPIIYR